MPSAQGMDDVEFLLSCVVSSGGCKTVALSVQSTAGVHEWHHFESLWADSQNKGTGETPTLLLLDLPILTTAALRPRVEVTRSQANWDFLLEELGTWVGMVMAGGTFGLYESSEGWDCPRVSSLLFCGWTCLHWELSHVTCIPLPWSAGDQPGTDRWLVCGHRTVKMVASCEHKLCPDWEASGWESLVWPKLMAVVREGQSS